MGFIIPAAVTMIGEAIGGLSAVGSAVGAAATASGVGTALTVGSTLLGAGSAIYGGVTQQQAYNYQKKVGYMNAEIDRNNRANALAAGAEAESRVKMKGDAVLGAQRAGYASQGVDIGVGSPQELAAATQLEVDRDAAVTHYNALNEAYGFSVQEYNDLSSAAMAKAAGKNALTKGVLEAGATLLGGATSLGKQWSAMQAAGMGSKGMGYSASARGGMDKLLTQYGGA